MGCGVSGFCVRWSSYLEAFGRGERVRSCAKMRAELLELLSSEGLSIIALSKQVSLPPRLIYAWRSGAKNRAKGRNGSRSKKGFFRPLKLKESSSSSEIVLQTPKGYALQGLHMTDVQQWIEQGVL